MVGGMRVCVAKQLGPGAAFVATNSDAYHIVGLEPSCFVRDALRFIDPEMPDSDTRAADWVVRLQGETAGEGDWLAFDRWLGESKGNGLAYDRALALWPALEAFLQQDLHDLTPTHQSWSRLAQILDGRP